MMPRVRIRDALVDLTEQIGVGGEATVYRWTPRNGSQHAVKLWHPAGGDPTAYRLLQLKVRKIDEFPHNLPAAVIAPEAPALDPTSRNTVGFAMPLVRHAEEVGRLIRRKTRIGLFPNQRLCALFRRLRAVLERLHKLDVVVGDLNDGNVLYTDDLSGPSLYMIDTDSMQFGTFPCPVGHDRFLDPRLYGVDLSRQPHFTPETDWFSFAVMLFHCLLFVHPYGGTHKRYPTRLRRAEAGVSVLQNEVRLPKKAADPQTLPDDMLDWFSRVFDWGHRGVFPEQLLDTRWTTCSCGTEHARKSCPACAVTVAIEAVLNKGRCRTCVVYSGGRVLTATVDGGRLRYAYEKNGRICREDASVIVPSLPHYRLLVGIAGEDTWVGQGDRIIRVRNGTPHNRVGVDTLGGLPMFDTSGSLCFYVQNGWLRDSRYQRHGQTIPDQTWFRCGEHLGFGFYRVGLAFFFFLFRTQTRDFRMVRIPEQLRGRVTDADVASDENYALFSFALEFQGTQTNYMFLVRADGTLKASTSGDPDERMRAVHGKALFNSRLLCSTDDGLLSLNADPVGKTITEGMLFTDTEPFVARGDELLPCSENSVYVVSTTTIRHLTLA